MNVDFSDKDFSKRLMCMYCQLPINNGPFMLINEKILFLRIINHPVHPECSGAYRNLIKNRFLAYTGVVIGIVALGLAILTYYR
jgi:hypothetical protein|tara:strand:- start:1274 stop:1525 length:252 start_codon:yes stop_codon:yes gene_type:complete